MESLNRRREMGKDLKFVEIEYLETNEDGGLAWIDTKYVPDGRDIDIYIDFMFLDGVFRNRFAYFMLAWTPYVGTSKGYAIFGPQKTEDNNIYIQSGGDVNNTNYFTSIQIEKYTKYSLSMFTNSRKYIINDITGNLVGPYLDAPQTDTIKLFSYNNRGVISSRIYKFRIDNNGMTELDLIPVRIGGKGYMYDKVSGKLFGNSGEGKFILEPDIN